jgi:hypothetical protein
MFMAGPHAQAIDGNEISATEWSLAAHNSSAKGPRKTQKAQLGCRGTWLAWHWNPDERSVVLNKQEAGFT